MSKSIIPERLATAPFDDAQALADRLIGLCASRKLSLATAESCTAGLLAHRLSRPPGAASVLAGGFVTYTKAAKYRLVDVAAQLLAEQTAVHADVAEAMARGALARAGTDLALSVTGVTGAEPDEDGNPIGRVFVGFAMSESAASLHCEFGRLAPAALTHLALQAALTFALSQLGETAARRVLKEAVG
jgi:nicotinamide-nucleotide amidase